MENYHLQSIAQVLKDLQVSDRGLSTKEAEKRLETYGLNKLPASSEKTTHLKIFLQQWKSPLILILAVAGIISGSLGEIVDMIVIFITVGVNVSIGFIQEFKADQALKKLNKLVSYKAVVLREGRETVIDSVHIVPGDIMIIDAGTKIQADGRIFECSDLQINESVLTGESESIEKHTKKLIGDLVISDRKNMVYKGTSVINGRAHVVITATGAHTEIGAIASLVDKTRQEKTPLQRQLGKMGRVIGIIVLCLSLGIFLLGVLVKSEHHSLLEMFKISVALAVAAIPEGLVISMTAILAIGMQHILKRKALVRKLLAAETLGSVSVICTDKTGTLTEGNMKVTHAVTANDEISGQELDVVHMDDEGEHRDILFALRIGVMCNDSILENPHEVEGKWNFVGDTTDTALVYAGMKAGLQKHDLDNVLRRIAEIPFDSVNKFMATLHHVDHESLVYIKGAPEVLYDKCMYYEENGETKKMNKHMQEWFSKQEDILTGKGLRVLALAYKRYDTHIDKLSVEDIDDIILVGLIALSDPLRESVKETIEKARGAGIRIIMITGDHMRTARSIGLQLGIPSEDDNIFNGRQLEDIGDEDLQRVVEHISIFARVDPKHKIRIVQALQARGEVVAMTGDGINDAPALKGSDIGVAVGSGTDVAKEISDIILLDDNFETIVSAVEEGRGIYQNIKKVILYLMSNSLIEVILIAGSLIAGLPLALLPAQILWINLVQEGAVAFSLGFDKGDKENMKDMPRKKDESIIDSKMKFIIVLVSVIPNVILFSIFLFFLKTTQDISLARTLMFVGVGIGSLFYIFSIRSLRKMIWQINPFGNKFLIYALLVSWFILFSSIYFEPLQKLLRTVPLTFNHWMLMIGFGLLNVILIELVKGIILIKKHNYVT